MAPGAAARLAREAAAGLVELAPAEAAEVEAAGKSEALLCLALGLLLNMAEDPAAARKMVKKARHLIDTLDTRQITRCVLPWTCT
jgi:hypothetical protein